MSHGKAISYKLTYRLSALTIAILLFPVAPSIAEIGKLSGDYKANFGEPVKLPNAENVPELVRDAQVLAYQKEGWDIRVLFVNNWSKAVLYKKTKADKDGVPEKMTDADVEWLLKYSGGTRKWVKDISLGNRRHMKVLGLEAVHPGADNVPEPQLLEWLETDEQGNQQGASGTSWASYSTNPKYLEAVTDHRILFVSCDAAEKAFAAGHGDLQEVLNPPAEKKKPEISKEQIDRDREWVAKYMKQVESNAKREYTRTEAMFGRKRAIEKAIDYLEDWEGVIEAKVEGEYIRIKYRGDMTGAVHIGPEKK